LISRDLSTLRPDEEELKIGRGKEKEAIPKRKGRRKSVPNAISER
jgi:hypothetical protein